MAVSKTDESEVGVQKTALYHFEIDYSNEIGEMEFYPSTRTTTFAQLRRELLTIQKEGRVRVFIKYPPDAYIGLVYCLENGKSIKEQLIEGGVKCLTFPADAGMNRILRYNPV